MNNIKLNTQKQDTLSIQIQKEEPKQQQQQLKKKQTIIQAIDAYPAESLVRILAKLFDRITRLNDHLNNNNNNDQNVTPATPSSQLINVNNNTSTSTSTYKSSISPIRPAQSPTVLQFQQNLNINNHTFNPNSNNNEMKMNEKNYEQLTTASKKILSEPSSILTFHAKVVPQISIEAYLLRILKYCPTPNGVFLSCLVYLDRLSKISFFFNPDHYQKQSNSINNSLSFMNNNQNTVVHFLVDSWNIHRFLIASITVASKLFSDVFYTNARYAKVGGLPLEELEELEMKFLLMSDFRLMIKTEEFEIYATKLLLLVQQHEHPEDNNNSFSSSSSSSSIHNDYYNVERKLEKDELTNSQEEQEQQQEEEEDDDDDEIVVGRGGGGGGKEMDVHVLIEPNNNNNNNNTNTNTCWRSSSIDNLSSSSSSSSTTSSSCNSSEHSSCSTITPHSPTATSSSTPIIAAFNTPTLPNPTSTIA